MKEPNTTMKSRNAKTSLFVPIAFCVFVCCVFLSMIFVSCRRKESKLEEALQAYQKFYKRNETLSADLLLEIQISALTGYDLSLQADVVEAFKELGDRAVFPNLINTLNDNDNHNWVRGNAAEALGELGDKRCRSLFDKRPQR